MSDLGRVLILGHTGKLGRALGVVFSDDHEVIGRSRSGGLDAADFEALGTTLEQCRPGLVLNAAALNGLDPCERDPASAFRLNALMPRFLAVASRTMGFTLVHFSSDAVFDGGRSSGSYRESDTPAPINIYGLTKYGGDCFVRSEAARFYIFRLSLMAGASHHGRQFVERIIETARSGKPLRIADDIICSPSYVMDIAREVRRVVSAGMPFGLYHLANAGSASLYRIVQELLKNLAIPTPLEPVPHTTFPTLARKNIATPLVSEKLDPLRPWEAAFREYCDTLGQP